MSESTKSRELVVRVVSYNVLSSHLAAPDHFLRCRPQDLDFENRAPRVLDKLDMEIKFGAGTGRPVVFCLQDVSHTWAGHLHTFFANRNYHMLTGLYGKKFNNYMGIALAYPTDSFETVFVDIARLSDHRVGGWPRKKSAQGGCARACVKCLRRLICLPTREKPPDHWELSENRFNILLTACLRWKDLEEEADATGGCFVISNYNMPSAFYVPMVMNIHAEMVARRCQDLARGDPHLLVGDFNFLPDSPHYKLLTTGNLDQKDPTYPTAKGGMEWSSNIAGMRSAYAVSEHGEPDFTNYAQVEDDDPFIGTLDYIFLSDEWKVSGVKRIAHRKVVDGPFPTEEEPSDHVLIAADLFLPHDAGDSKIKSDLVDDSETAKIV